jgi:thioredoxin reductase (NADPH)
VRPLLLDRTGAAGGLVTNAYSVENYPGLEQPATGPELAARFAAFLERFQIEVVRADVDSIAWTGEAALLETSLGTIASRAAIVATGTEPLAWDVTVPETLLSRTASEVGALLPLQPREVVIVGGGEAACDYGLSLARAGSRVQILVRGPRLRACDRLCQLVSAEPQIRTHYDTRVHEVLSESGRAVILTEAGSRFVADALLTAIGRRATTPTLLVDSCTIPDEIMIVGDAHRGALGQVGIAVGEGITAAARAAESIRGGGQCK